MEPSRVRRCHSRGRLKDRIESEWSECPCENDVGWLSPGIEARRKGIDVLSKFVLEKLVIDRCVNHIRTRWHGCFEQRSTDTESSNLSPKNENWKNVFPSVERKPRRHVWWTCVAWKKSDEHYREFVSKSERNGWAMNGDERSPPSPPHQSSRWDRAILSFVRCDIHIK